MSKSHPAPLAASLPCPPLHLTSSAGWCPLAAHLPSPHSSLPMQSCSQHPFSYSLALAPSPGTTPRSLTPILSVNSPLPPLSPPVAPTSPPPHKTAPSRTLLTHLRHRFPPPPKAVRHGPALRRPLAALPRRIPALTLISLRALSSTPSLRRPAFSLRQSRSPSLPRHRCPSPHSLPPLPRPCLHPPGVDTPTLSGPRTNVTLLAPPKPAPHDLLTARYAATGQEPSSSSPCICSATQTSSSSSRVCLVLDFTDN